MKDKDVIWWQTCTHGMRMVPILGQLESYMDVLTTRQKLVASNIANVDTPGYHTKDIDFLSEFKAELNGTAGAGLPTEVEGLRMKADGNNVNLDREARLLSENSIRFSVAENMARGQLKMLKSAIHDGQSS